MLPCRRVKLKVVVSNQSYMFIIYTNQLERDPIHYAIYEKVAIPPKAVIPRLWTYRPRITTETFFQELQMNNDRDNNPLYPILYRLSENVRLFVVRYSNLLIVFAGNYASSNSISSRTSKIAAVFVSDLSSKN